MLEALHAKQKIGVAALARRVGAVLCRCLDATLDAASRGVTRPLASSSRNAVVAVQAAFSAGMPSSRALVQIAVVVARTMACLEASNAAAFLGEAVGKIGIDAVVIEGALDAAPDGVVAGQMMGTVTVYGAGLEAVAHRRWADEVISAVIVGYAGLLAGLLAEAVS